ncbi:HAMP domain-containing sensor histidine kinase [Sphingomonas sp. 1P06PA]|uniref:histidine kinase dimerization/phospho-acceptor domain-containing protein n=1 Tax=Sphingomonas sp. 1P06PA TaxID=554121 RepID=UPI0039A4F0BD
MRFDDMLATLLAQRLDSAAAKRAAWVQIVDVLAQGRGGAATDDAYDRLRALRDEVPLSVRAAVAAGLAGRQIPEALVRLFAEEPPAIAAPLLAGVTLPAAAWMALLPALGPTTRGVVRNRRDLPLAVVQALGAFGAIDLVMSGPVAELLEPEAPRIEDDRTPTPGGDAQIRDLVARIDAFRRRKPFPGAPLAGEPAIDRETRAESFRFETGADGVLRWVEGAPREALVGETLAIAATSSGQGVDGQVAGAFRHRAPFRDARLSVAGDGPTAGEWRISAVPFFDPAGGRFTGYRGTARRPRADESAAPVNSQATMPGVGFAPDSLRQLVHELRTPINAIVGFAEMIDRQVLGPAAALYRDRAREIASEGRRLLDAVDDLDAAARVDTRRWDVAAGSTDPARILARLHDAHETLAAGRGVRLTLRIATDAAPVGADPVAVERMLGRLLASAIAVAGAGETVTATLTRDGGDMIFAVDRPAALAGRDDHALLDPGYSPDGDWPDAPLLGLGFALRLVRNIADAAHGTLAIEPDQFVLRLPMQSAPVRGEEERQG